MDNNWVVDNLQNAFTTWNTKMEEMWGLLTQSPETFKGGTIWSTIVTINGGMQAIGYGLLVLFFAISLFRSAASFRDFQRPEYVVRHLIQFVLAKVAITYGLDFLTKIFAVCNGIVATAAGSIGGADGASITMPAEIIDAINSLGFLESIPLWLVTLLGSLFVTVLAFIMILTVYGRFLNSICTPLFHPSPFPPLRGKAPPLSASPFSKATSASVWRGPWWCWPVSSLPPMSPVELPSSTQKRQLSRRYGAIWVKPSSIFWCWLGL